MFAEGACEHLLAAGAARVVSTDTIPHPTNAIGIGELLAAGAEGLFGAADTGPDRDGSASAAEWFDDGEPTPWQPPPLQTIDNIVAARRGRLDLDQCRSADALLQSAQSRLDVGAHRR